MLQHVITFLHGLLCFAIVALVLLQRGKGADAGAGFGAGASGTVFGARGSATFFSKLTAILATLFFLTSMSLAWFATRPNVEAPKSIVDTVVSEPAPETGVDGDAVPVLPEAPPSG
jgi:preprotein translocase subunit SecG